MNSTTLSLLNIYKPELWTIYSSTSLEVCSKKLQPKIVINQNVMVLNFSSVLGEGLENSEGEWKRDFLLDCSFNRIKTLHLVALDTAHFRTETVHRDRKQKHSDLRASKQSERDTRVSRARNLDRGSWHSQLSMTRCIINHCCMKCFLTTLFNIWCAPTVHDVRPTLVHIHVCKSGLV